MAENKTKENDANVEDFLNSIEDEIKRKDCFLLLGMMKKVTNLPAKMWGDNMVGFGTYHYVYESGREGDIFLIGFSPRKNYLSLYLVTGFTPYEDLMAKLGKFKTGKSCLNIKKLSDVKIDVLKSLMEEAYKVAKDKHL